MEKIQEFYLNRLEDESGVSGTGVVARGVILPSGKCVLEWSTFHSSVAIYANLGDVEIIHGHDGKTQVIIGTPKPPRKRKS
jgi:hypothetical protein